MNFEAVEFHPTMPPGRAMVVLNPEAGHGSFRRKQRYAGRAKARLQQHGWEVSARTTQHAGHEKSFAEEAVADGFNAIFTAGGDGTPQHMLQVLAGTETTLGVLPMGIINLWAREAGIPRSPERAVDAQLSGTVKQMDVGVVNDAHYFRTTAGVGFDGSVLNALKRFQDSDGRRRIRGTALYFATCGVMYPSGSSTEAEIAVDGETFFDGSMFQTWVGNSRLLGYMKLRPEGLVDDGQFEVTVFPKLGPAEFIENAGSALRSYIKTREGDRVPAAAYNQGAAMTIKTENPVYAQVDGELLSQSPTSIHTIRALRESLRVFVPSSPAANSLFQRAA